MRGTVGHNRPQWMRLFRSLFVPLLLVVAQQGGMLHELSHYAPAERAGDTKKQSHRSDVCDLCLAFAQIGSAAPVQHVAPLPLAGLSHEVAPVVPGHLEVVHLPAERSRGPPQFL